MKKHRVKKQRKKPPAVTKKSVVGCKISLEKTDDLTTSAIKAIQSLPESGVVVFYQAGVDRSVIDEIKKKVKYTNGSYEYKIDSFYKKQGFVASFLRAKLLFSRINRILFVLHCGSDADGKLLKVFQDEVDCSMGEHDVRLDIVCHKSARARLKKGFEGKVFVCLNSGKRKGIKVSSGKPPENIFITNIGEQSGKPITN